MPLLTLPYAAYAQDAGPPVSVSIVTAAAKDVPVTQNGLGTVQAFNNVLIRARVDGAVQKINFTEGQEVAVGDTLVVIDPRPYQTVLDQATAKKAADEAQLANAKLNLQRDANLANNQFASRQQVDNERAQVDQLTASLLGDDASIAAARLNLTFCVIQAPIAGRMGLRLVDVGNLVHANDTQGLVTIAQIKPISVVFTLPQDALPSVQDAMAQGTLKAIAQSSDDNRPLGEGELLTPDNTIDTTTGTIKLKANFPNDNHRLWPGQFVNVQLVLGTLRGVTTVPTTTVQHGPNGLYVYLVQPDNTVTRRDVHLKQDDGTLAVIADGLAVGDKVVSAGQSRLQAGSHVVAVQDTPTAPDGAGKTTSNGG